MTRRRGASSMGCLFTLLVVAAILYFGVNIGEVYWRAYQFEDDMRQQVKFAARTTNDAILIHLRATVDSLGLPDDAKQIVIHRSAKAISIEAEYDERVELPMYVRDKHFHPYAEGPL